MIQVLLAQPRGFCAGVIRAIDIVDRALDKVGAPVFVRHEIVHNRHVVDTLKAKGAVFVEELDEVPAGAVTVFSAHGVSREVERVARERHLPVIDATCPLVTKVHVQGRKYVKNGHVLVLIGHAGHPEVEGTLGQIDGEVHLVGTPEEVAALPIADDARVAYVTQTTLAVDDTRAIIAALKARFVHLTGPDTSDICYATQNRQMAARALCERADLLLVVGSPNSSNSRRLREIGEEMGRPSYLIEDGAGLDPAWLAGVTTVGLTAGASAPEELVQSVIQAIAAISPVTVSPLDGIEETLQFRLPPALDRLTPRPAAA
ncbi:4-hydroxy-3-methylbut-2-enyl diphosphate reductase [Sphingomonas morindae]|uniref:4-hydroxy-3-methylbut-2-enyl diphosphate reductase n=1 Tax=Sphingomonas morindae TaxID=1541170 RepID=A0ABY4X493_9SPHN|nr:4-hydroxy-3-methylbut-2-enyl diphosphate reductase [Sphingomonas morindae]USI71670.1 4-hydroxy-3-methylbut-2-enyl diphosphate reductase [Sphingomonas morindae]